MCAQVYAAARPERAWREKDLYVGVDVEFGPQQRRKIASAAVLQLAVADFVVIIPLEVLKWPAQFKPVKDHAVVVRLACPKYRTTLARCR